MNPLTFIALEDFPRISPGDDLGIIIANSLKKNQIKPEDGDILVIASKIISKSEGRYVDLDDITPGRDAKELSRETRKDPRIIQLILDESAKIIRHREGLIIAEHKLGFICANAGIDHSNIQSGDEERVILLPVNPDRSADKIRVFLERIFNCSLGVLIIDSHGRAWRYGTVGITIGNSYVPMLVDFRGTHDMEGNLLSVTRVGSADELAGGASLLMGTASEGTPVIHVRGFPYPLSPSSTNDISRSEDQDLFR